MPSRRAALLLPCLAAACAREEPLGPAPGPLSFRHLLPLRLNVATLVQEPGEVVPLPGDLGLALPVPPAAAVWQMAEERIRTVGSTGRASFRVTQASLVRDSSGVTCQVGCRLEVVSNEGQRTGFVEAQARAAQSLSEGAPPANRTRAAEIVLRQAMERLNVEFEFQIRRNLRAWLVEVVPGSEGAMPAPSGEPGVTREELPRG